MQGYGRGCLSRWLWGGWLLLALRSAPLYARKLLRVALWPTRWGRAPNSEAAYWPSMPGGSDSSRMLVESLRSLKELKRTRIPMTTLMRGSA